MFRIRTRLVPALILMATPILATAAEQPNSVAPVLTDQTTKCLLPDLVITELRLLPGYATTKHLMVPVSMKVQNIGHIAAGPFDVMVLCRMIGRRPATYKAVAHSARPLAPRATVHLGCKLRLPKGFAKAPVSIKALADYMRRIRERDERNNTRVTHGRVAVR